MTLAELQRLFWASATREGLGPVDLAAAFVGTPALAASARLGIYADMYAWRQIDVLREDFPKLASLLGDAAFHALGEAYLRAHPSAHHSLSRFGEHLEEHLRAHPGSRPDAADLAALEWARAEVFEEADAEPASPAVLHRLAAAGRFEDVALAAVPALRRLRLRTDVLPLWRRLEDGLAAPAPSAEGTAAVVWRKGFETFHVALAADEAAAFDLAASGQPLSVVCGAFAERADPVAAAFQAIGSWFAEGWIAARGLEETT